jgi:transposase
MEVFAGVDWGCGSHAACVVDARGEVLDRFAVGHDREGLAALAARLRRHGAPPVAVERPTGLPADHLIESGLAVVPIHPDAVKACRPRYRAVSAEGDPGDAYVLADVPRTDGHRLRPLRPQGDAIKALRALVRGRDDLVAARVALANQLTALLEGFWPGAAAIFADVASPIALAFLDRYPTPEAAGRLGPKRLAAFLAQHRYCGRRSP